MSQRSGTLIRVNIRETLGGQPRLVESWFPYIDVSRLVAADRRSRDSVYGVHKWFARRPPTLVRALLIASHLTEDAGPEAFWRLHSEPGMWLQGSTVYDPFMGGGTSLVESARMGASVVGRDVDPIAAEVVKLELHGLTEGFETTSASLIEALEEACQTYFKGPDQDWIPLHWFWLLKPVCPECQESNLLYKDLIIATSVGRNGAVVRDSDVHAFCPTCLRVHELDQTITTLNCCDKSYSLTEGSFARGKYVCPKCSRSSTHEQLQTGTSQRVLLAVEETRPGFRRRIRAATKYDTDVARLPAADTTPSKGFEFDIPLQTNRRDKRPLSAGYDSLKKLFTRRQWAVFTTAFSQIRTMAIDEYLERELTLMLTGALPSNNILCGYARAYGRLAPLFSVRSFSYPSLIVELNPFHPTGGRGTLKNARTRVLDRSNAHVRRSRILSDIVERVSFELPVKPTSFHITTRSADDSSEADGTSADICVTDPPYFDYIAYSELSELFRLWLRKPRLVGVPLLPDGDSPIESFASGLGGALKETLTRLQPGTPLVFTYHSSKQDAWQAIGDALDIANLSVVALWPILADPHMGHHTADGNCEWDVVVVARYNEEFEKIAEIGVRNLPEEWLREIETAGFSVGHGDRSSFEYAWRMSKKRLASLRPID